MRTFILIILFSNIWAETSSYSISIEKIYKSNDVFVAEVKVKNLSKSNIEVDEFGSWKIYGKRKSGVNFFFGKASPGATANKKIKSGEEVKLTVNFSKNKTKIKELDEVYVSHRNDDVKGAKNVKSANAYKVSVDIR